MCEVVQATEPEPALVAAEIHDQVQVSVDALWS
jgi:hypothetical protein